MSGAGGNGVVVFDHFDPPPGTDLTAHPLAWWLACKLVTTLSDPRRHDVELPSGERVELTTGQMLSATKLREAILDQAGELPPLPEKNQGAFLREIWTELFKRRRLVVVDVEATPAGAIAADLERILRCAPESERPEDMARGAVCVAPGGARLFNSRVMQERLRRVAVVAVSPADYYAALRSLGCTNRNMVRVGDWAGRCWEAPAPETEPLLDP